MLCNFSCSFTFAVSLWLRGRIICVKILCRSLQMEDKKVLTSRKRKRFEWVYVSTVPWVCMRWWRFRFGFMSGLESIMYYCCYVGAWRFDNLSISRLHRQAKSCLTPSSDKQVFTWLWGRLLSSLSKHQSPTTALFRIPILSLQAPQVWNRPQTYLTDQVETGSLLVSCPICWYIPFPGLALGQSWLW